MTDSMPSSELLATYEALDESRQKEIAEHALELIEEQRNGPRTEQRI